MDDELQVRRVAVIALAAVLLLAGCTRDAASPSARAVTTSPTAAAHADDRHRPWSDVNPPPRRAGDLVVKVLALSRMPPEGRDVSTRSGPGFWQEEVRTCVKASSRRSETVGWRDWRAEGLDGRHYVAGAGADLPAYPAHEVLAPGECVAGWWLVTVPHDRPIRAIQLAPGGGRPILEWMSMR